MKPVAARQNVSQLKKTPTLPTNPSVEDSNSDSSNDSADSTNSSAAPSDTQADGIKLREMRPLKRKRRKVDPTEDLEARYLDRLAREDEEEHTPKLQDGATRIEEAVEQDSRDTSPEIDAPVPLHETLNPEVNDDASLRNKRTVFLGNVSTTAIKSKSAKKTLVAHLSSILPALPTETGPYKIESIRFRSVAFSNSISRRAAYAKKELKDETTKSTNAYVVYSTEAAARRAARQLNGTMILDRHLRADLVAHPSKIDHKRCIFVGNLSFVDEETPANAPENEARDRPKKRNKEPSDAEEGLWRTFSKCGTVESVRVIRDGSTRIGKGFAYVQFADANAVEAALLYHERKFPPMLPRTLRVVRAKGMKRKDVRRHGGAGGGDQRSKGPARSQGKGFKGAVSKLAKEAAASSAGGRSSGGSGIGMRNPEAFVFEGHRASSARDRVVGSKLKVKGKGKKGRKSGKPENRSTRRAAAHRAAGRGGQTKIGDS